MVGARYNVAVLLAAKAGFASARSAARSGPVTPDKNEVTRASDRVWQPVGNDFEKRR